MSSPRMPNMVGMPSIVKDTKFGKKIVGHEAGFMKLVAESRAIIKDTPVMEGVIKNTKIGAKLTDVPELHKTHNRGKTQPRSMGQVPYSGKFY
jgi:hypothetical protein